MSADLELDDLRALGMPDPPKLNLLIDPKVEAVIKAPQHAFNSGAVALALCAMTGFAYELVRECDDRTNPHSDPVLEFYRHARNAAFHGNTFDIHPKVSTKLAKWRGREIDPSHAEREEALLRVPRSW